MTGYISPQGTFVKGKGEDPYKWAIDICKNLKEPYECGFECLKYLLDNGYIEIQKDGVWWGDGFNPTKEQVDYIIKNKKKFTQMQYISLYDAVAKYGDMKMLEEFLEE